MVIESRISDTPDINTSIREIGYRSHKTPQASSQCMYQEIQMQQKISHSSERIDPSRFISRNSKMTKHTSGSPEQRFKCLQPGPKKCISPLFICFTLVKLASSI